MRLTPALFLLTLLVAQTGMAQDTRYVSDKQFVPLRSGAGNQYRIVHRGIPSGTKMRVGRTSEDGVWAEITTERGTSGWIRTQYLMEDVPAQLRVEAAERRAREATDKSAALAQELSALKAERGDLQTRLTSSGSELQDVSEELSKLKQISSKAVQLDIDNRRLVEDAENLRSRAEMLEGENQRLQDKLRSEDFLNGALAVMLGVIITLVVPRLVPKRRRQSEWA